jgi:hypothetical protein
LFAHSLLVLMHVFDVQVVGLCLRGAIGVRLAH